MQTVLEQESPTPPPARPSLPKMDLDDLRRPIKDELEAFHRYFRGAMKSDMGLLDSLVRYLLRSKGKQLRPMLVLLSAKVCGDITETTYRGAALVELLHTATLVHDDVVDHSEKRRGRFSINALWKNKIAVLFGDFLLSRGLLLALEHKDYDLLHTMSSAVRRMSEGELLQVEKARKLDVSEDLYFRIISDKTASLISACTAAGAVSVTDDPEVRSKMSELGEQLGIAFQIRDDLFDYGVEDVGKPLGIDLKDRKLTLPLIYTLQKASPETKREIIRLVRKGKVSNADVKRIGKIVEEHGGLSYARAQMTQYADRARSIAVSFPPGDARDALERLIEYTIHRSR